MNSLEANGYLSNINLNVVNKGAIFTQGYSQVQIDFTKERGIKDRINDLAGKKLPFLEKLFTKSQESQDDFRIKFKSELKTINLQLKRDIKTIKELKKQIDKSQKELKKPGDKLKLNATDAEIKANQEELAKLQKKAEVAVREKAIAMYELEGTFLEGSSVLKDVSQNISKLCKEALTKDRVKELESESKSIVRLRKLNNLIKEQHLPPEKVERAKQIFSEIVQEHTKKTFEKPFLEEQKEAARIWKYKPPAPEKTYLKKLKTESPSPAPAARSRARIPRGMAMKKAIRDPNMV